MKFPVGLASFLLICCGCTKKPSKPIDIVLPIAPGGDAVEAFRDSARSGFYYHYAFSDSMLDPLIRYHDSIFSTMGLLVFERDYYGEHFKRKLHDGRWERWFSKGWITPDSQTIVTFFARERDSIGHLFMAISQEPYIEPKAVEVHDISACIAQWEKSETSDLPESCAERFRDSLPTILRDRYIETRHGAWREGSSRMARLIIDIVPLDTAKPFQSVIRWADDGSIALYGAKSRPIPARRVAETARWADDLERMLQSRHGADVPRNQRLMFGGEPGFVAAVRKNGTWEKFDRFETMDDKFANTDAVTREYLLAHPSEAPFKIDSAAELVTQIVKAMGVE